MQASFPPAVPFPLQALPTIALFVGGKQVFRFEGVMTEPQLTERLNYLMGQASAQ